MDFRRESENFFKTSYSNKPLWEAIGKAGWAHDSRFIAKIVRSWRVQSSTKVHPLCPIETFHSHISLVPPEMILTNCSGRLVYRSYFMIRSLLKRFWYAPPKFPAPLHDCSLNLHSYSRPFEAIQVQSCILPFGAVRNR